MSSSIKKKFLRNTLIVSSFTMISRIFGYIRDAAIFIFISNSSGALDAFFVAFRIPNFFRRIFGEGALSTAYVPVLSDYKNNAKGNDAKEFINSSITYLCLILLIISIVGVAITPILIYLIAPGFVYAESGQYELSYSLLRITFPFMFFICLTAVLSSILNCYEKFSMPAFTPVIVNITLILSILFFSDNFDEPVYALAWGLIFGGFIQVVFLLYPLIKMGLFPKISFNKKHPGIKKIKELMLPMILGSSVTQINLIFDTIIASFLITGSIGWLYMSDRFIELPLALFGISIATVLLPKLSEYYNKSDCRSYNATFNWGLKIGIIISLPTSIGLILLAEPILITLLQYREFSVHDVNMTAIGMIAFAIGLPGMIGAKILITNFYSRKNTKYPVRAAVIAVICNFLLNIIFVIYLIKSEFDGAHAGLALATSISAYINFFLLFKTALKTKIIEIDLSIKKIFIKSMIASIIMATFILYFDLNLNTWINLNLVGRLSNLFFIITSSIILYLVLLVMFGIFPKKLVINK
ncbi:murein biosynthesis integral membrane protein MurJ [Gammaproteobacteria bacterium]|nr:murein biosynthesis integral membrane protein MurJ [Gammaproteobacteria bacterium]